MKTKNGNKKRVLGGIRTNLLLFLIVSAFFLIIVPASATNNYTGNSSNCRECHQTQYDLWANSTHTSKLITSVDAQARGYPAPPGGYDWVDVSFVIGSKWKIRYVNDTGYIITNGGKNQFNIDDQVWTDYNKDTVKKYNCGHCHGTGYLSNVTDTVKEPFRTLRNQGQIPDGVYDNSLTPGFKGYWAENSIGCEACHGPGGEHVSSPTALNIRNASAVLNTPGICGDCHSRPLSSKYGEYDNFKPYPDGVNDSLLSETLTDDSPMPTVNYSKTGGHHEQWEDLKASVHAGNAVNCATCHGGHAVSNQSYAGGPTGKIKFTNGSVYPAAVNKTCTDCHALELPKHGLFNANSECISCHMPQNRKSSNKIDLRSHWFNVNALRSNKNPGVHTANLPALQSFAPQSCNTCHRATPGNFTGNSSNCKVCHEGQYALWTNTTHTSKLITKNDALERGYPAPPGGYAWEDVSFVIGSKWKIRYVNDTGYIITNGGRNQFNVDDQIWTDYNKDTVKKYNCGHCHATGYLSNVTDTVKEPFRTLRDQGQIPDGVYDNSLTPGFKGYWAENSIGCEACHGNGGDHVLSPNKFNIRNASAVRNTPGICGDCHSRPLSSKYGEYDNFKPYPDGVNDSLLSETLTDDSPMPTVNYSKTGGHHEQWEDAKASAHDTAGVNCVSCHGGHAVSNPAYAGGPTGKIKFNNGTVYPASVTQSCTNCHAPELPKHGYYTANSECISCHMPQNRKSSNKIDLRSHWYNVTAMKNNKNAGVHAVNFASVQNITESCVKCHGSASLSRQVNEAVVGNHKNINDTEGTGLLNSSDCKTCHNGATASALLNLKCQDCHTTAGTGPVKPTNPALIKDGLQHGVIDCQWCHTADDYHLIGPKGTASGADCNTCHVSANLQDAPFFAPGEGHEGDVALCSDCHSSADNHAVSPLNAFTPPSLSLNPITSVTSGVPAQVQATVNDDYMQIAAAQYRVTNTSGQVIPWTNMTPNGGRYSSSSQGVSASIATSSMKGVYTVEVKGMASAYKTNPALPYYPHNGQWSGISSTQLTVVEATGYANGTVSGSLGNIAGAIVATNTSVFTTTDASGFYSLSLPNGTYQLTASREPEYYPNNSVTATVTAFTTVVQDIVLSKKPTGTISGVVTNASSGLSLSNVYIRLNYSQYNATTDSAGNYVINNVPTGNYQITASKEGYFPNTSNITVNTGTNTFNIALKTGYYYYFAEGYVTADNTFREYVTIGNPNDRAANVIVSHMLSSGSTVDKQYTINPNTRFTETVGSVLMGANAPLVISDMPVIVERPMYFYKAWGSITDGHNTIGATSLSNTWYFAEGYISPNFRAYVTIQNPNAAPANVSIKHVLGDGSLVYNNVTIGATSRYTETVSSYVSSGAVSFVITSDLPVVAERPIYFDKAWSTVSGGHNTIGASSLSKTWYFAEGYVSTDNTFKEYLTIGNPNNIAASVTVSHMLANGSTIDKQYTIPANTRFTETVANVLTGANSIKVTSDIPVMAERPMYFYNAWGSITGGHNTIGATELSNTWYFAEGYISPNFRAYVTVQNPHAAAASVSIKHVLGDGSVVYNNVTIGATSRYTETVSSFVSSGAVSFVITSDLPVVAERPIYFDKAWGTVSGGHNTIGYSKLQ